MLRVQSGPVIEDQNSDIIVAASNRRSVVPALSMRFSASPGRSRTIVLDRCGRATLSREFIPYPSDERGHRPKTGGQRAVEVPWPAQSQADLLGIKRRATGSVEAGLAVEVDRRSISDAVAMRVLTRKRADRRALLIGFAGA